MSDLIRPLRYLLFCVFVLTPTLMLIEGAAEGAAHGMEVTVWSTIAVAVYWPWVRHKATQQMAAFNEPVLHSSGGGYRNGLATPTGWLFLTPTHLTFCTSAAPLIRIPLAEITGFERGSVLVVFRNRLHIDVRGERHTFAVEGAGQWVTALAEAIRPPRRRAA